MPVDVPQRRGDPLRVGADEGIRPDSTEETLARLRPAFLRDGTITAGNASQISDGAAAVVVMSADRAAALGIDPLAEILSHGMSADRFAWLHTVPALALQRAADKAGVRPGDLDLIEINEAFAAVALNSARMLGSAGRSRQRQRRLGRPRSPDRSQRRPSRPYARLRAAPARCQARRSRALRRGRPGRRALDPQPTGSLASECPQSDATDAVLASECGHSGVTRAPPAARGR